MTDHPRPISVVLADDQALIRSGFRALIDSAADLTVVGEADDGRAAVDLVRSERPDVVLMDIRMPALDGLAATREICADDALADTRVIILTTFELDEYVWEAVRSGASGFLGKNVAPDELLSGIRTVAGGDALLSPRATRAMLARFADPSGARGDATPTFDDLTEREREMVVLAAHGLSNDDIAERAYLSPFTVKTHLNRAMTKLGCRDRAQLVVAAYQNGLVRPGDAPPA